MAVTFECGSTEVAVADNARQVVTSRGLIAASDLAQGDMVCISSGQPLVEITTVPVVT